MVSFAVPAVAAMAVTSGAQAQERTVESANEFLGLFARSNGFRAYLFLAEATEPSPRRVSETRAYADRVTSAAVYEDGVGRPGCATTVEFGGSGWDHYWDKSTVEKVEWVPELNVDRQVPFVMVKQPSAGGGTTYVAYYPERAGDLDRLYEAFAFLQRSCSRLTATGF
jgi:hypothetical protein